MHMTEEMMAAESGGLLARKKHTCLQFTSKPSAIVYLPSLNCLIATSCNGAVEVLDIHSGCMLKKVYFTDENGESEGELLCTIVDDCEKFFITKGNVIGCRGVHGEKILLDSILQHDNKEESNLKIELDIVQAGILLNGLQACQRRISSPKQFVTDSAKVEEDVKTVTEELQKQYEKSLRTVKDFTNKSVKWMTVCLEMEKSQLSDAFVYIYSLISRQTQDPSLPIIGDVVRRISLCNPPKKKNDLGRIERMMMLGEVERLETFNTWPHQDYEYALPGPMAEAGFYHPAYSTASEDRAVCFKCDICLVYWEPSDQPWSEHERHSSSCPFVKGEYTENVPLSTCSAVCQAQSLKNQDEKILHIGCQSSEGLVVIGTDKGNVYLLETFPLLKLKYKLEPTIPRAVSDELKSQCAGEIVGDLGRSSSSSSLSNDQDGVNDANSNIEIATQALASPEKSVTADTVPLKSEGDSGSNSSLDNDKMPVSSQITIQVACQKQKPEAFHIETQALTVAKHQMVDEDGKKKMKNHVIIGRKCTVDSMDLHGHSKNSSLNILVVDKEDMKKIETKKVEQKPKKTNSGVGPAYPHLIHDPLLQNEFDSYVTSDTGELSVINEYLRASKEKEKEGGAKVESSKGEDVNNDARKSQEFCLPGFIDASSHYISHLFSTNNSLFVVVKCKFGKAGAKSLNNVENCSTSDLETEDLEMLNGSKNGSQNGSQNGSENGPKNGSKNGGNCASYILEYRWVLQGELVTIHESFVSSREFSTQDYLHDVILISYKNIGFREQRFDVVGEVCLESNCSELLLAATGTENKQLFVISTLDLTDLAVLPLDSLDVDCMIEKIVYCVGINVVACCLDSGKIVLCDLEGQAKETVEEPCDEQTPVAAQALDGPITGEKLSQLLQLIQFEPISNGVHVFLPMDWVVGRASLSANAPLQSKRRLHPHVQDIYPISSPSLLRGASGITEQKLKEKRLRSKDQSVTFKIFVSSETSIGYIDLAIECSSTLSEEANVFVFLYLIEQNESFLEQGEDNTQRDLICGPVSLLDYRSSEEWKASLMLTSPRLASVKSSYLAIDLEYHSSIGHERAECDLPSSSGNDGLKPSKVAIADFVSNVQIVIYQYLPVMQESHLTPSCRLFLIEDREIQRKLMKQLITAVCNGQCLGEQSEARKCLEIFVWIWRILTFSADFRRQQLLELFGENLTDLIKVCFIKGDRTLAHRVYQLIVSICRYSEKKGFTSFIQQLIIALDLVMEEVASFSSVGALRWFFRLCNAAVKASDPNDIEGLFKSMLSSLAEITKCHKDGISDKQLILQTRFDLVGSPLEPIIAEPVFINLMMGDNAKSKPEAQDGNEASQRKVLPVSASEVPGILEVHQLGFSCMMTSEGSKCETVSTSNDLQSQSLKVTLEPQKSHALAEGPTSPSISLTFDDDLLSLPFYDALNNIEPETTIDDYVGVDHSMFEVLEAENFDLWTPELSQRKTKIVKKKGRSVSQEHSPDIENEFITPESVLLVVERMHAAAQHFAILDFQRAIGLTDVLIPPCASLSSISVYAWKENQSEKEAQHVVTSNEIGQKALILNDIIPSIKCKYLKIIANGSRKLNSTKISIALGNFYGRPADGTYKANQLKSRLQMQYDRVFCRYALACDRLSNAIGDFTEGTVDSDGTLSEDSQNKLMRAYSDCAEMQLSLNHVFHSLKYYEAKSNVQTRSVSKRDESPLPLDFMRVLIECFLETILLSLQNIAKHKEIHEIFEIDNVNFEDSLDLFKNFCIFGPPKVRQLGSTLLQCICETQPWWNDFLIQAFRYCFEEKSSHGVPKNRLFIIFLRILKTASDRNGVTLSLANLLNESLAPLCEGHASKGQLDLELIDWLLLVFNELLQHFDQGDWVFLTPWNAMAKESSGLETRTQDQIRAYLQEQRKKLSTFHKRLQALASTKKKYSAIGMKIPEAPSSSKELKDLLLLRRHPLFNKKKAGRDANAADALSLFEESDDLGENKICFIEKRRVLPTLRLLFKLMLVSKAEPDFERLVLTCKVTSMLTIASNIPVHMAEITNVEDLTNLLFLSINAESDHAPWIHHAILCFIRQTLLKKRQASLSPLAGIADDTSIEIPVNLEAKPESSASSESSGESSETMSGQEGEPVEEKLTDIASSIATNLMKVIKESVNEKKGGQIKEDAMKFSNNTNRFGTPYNTYHLVDGFDKGLQMESNHVYYDNFDRINQIMMKGIWGSKTSIETGNTEITYDSQDNREDIDLVTKVFAKMVVSHVGVKNFSLFVCHWIAISSISESLPSRPTMQLPIEVTRALMLSQEFKDTNRYSDFLYENSMLSSVSTGEQVLGIEPLLEICSSPFRSFQSANTSRSLSLLKVFANIVNSKTVGGDTAANAEKEPKPPKLARQLDKRAKRFVKTLILEILKNERGESSLICEMLQLANNMPLFDNLEEDEVEITSEILRLLASSVRDFVTKNKELLLLSFIESNGKRKRLYIVDKGKQWQVGKSSSAEETDEQFFQSVSLLEKLIYPSVSNSETGSRLLKMIYGKDSNLLPDLLEVILLAGDPPLQPDFKLEYPACLMSRSEICKETSGLHPVIRKIYELVLRLGHSAMQWPRILELILSYIDKENGRCYFISKALSCLLKTLLQSPADTKLFIERGGLLVICSRIIDHAEMLKWSSNRKCGLRISETLTEKEEPDISSSKTRADVDGSDLKNLAPCGRVVCPPNSPPADILLQSKPNHRRSRFAAWSYQFNDEKSDWVPITIELPFAILLKQIVLYHHASFLGNCPAEIYVEVKGCGDTFIPHSPNLQASGLPAINIQFARGLTAKAVRIHMKRPLDSDVIKLNNIELFGKAALSSTNKSSAEFSKRFYWVELLDHILEKDESAVNEISKIASEEKTITKALLLFYNLTPSGKPHDSEILLNLLVKIFVKNCDEWKQLLGDSILPNAGKIESKRTVIQAESASMLISAVMNGLNSEKKISCFAVYFQWAIRMLQRGLSFDQREIHCSSVLYFKCIANMVDEHAVHDSMDHALVTSLTRTLLKFLIKLDVKDCRFRNYAGLLASLANMDTLIVEQVIEDCFVFLRQEELFKIANCGKSLLNIAAIVSQNKANNILIINSTLPSKICDVIQEILNAVSNPVTQNLRGYLSSMLVLLRYLIYAMKCHTFKDWFGQNCAFLRPLILFLSTAYLDKGLLSKDDLESDRLLGDFHKLQSATVSLIKIMVSFNRQNQMVFISIMKTILFKETRQELSLVKNSFLKRLVLQLILEEEEVVVHVKRRDGDLPINNQPSVPRSGLSFKNAVSKRLRLSDSLSSLFPVTKPAPVPKEERPRQPAAANEAGSAFHSEDWFDEGDWNDNTNFSVLLASAHSASLKRQLKQNGVSNEKGDANEVSLNIEYYHPLISKDSLPYDLTVGQIIHILENQDEPCVSGSITLFADIKQRESETCANLTQCAMLKASSYSSLLHVFAMDEGIQLLAKHNRMCLSGDFGQTISTSIGFLMKFVPLSGFSQMFLKETKKAEYLLRLMLGVEHSSNGDSIASSSLASDLPLLPFVALQDLFKFAPLESDHGRSLRQAAFDSDVIKLLLNHLGTLCYQETTNKESARKVKKAERTDGRPSYWARGTGFGTGSTASTWDVEKVIQEKRKEEDHVVCLLRVLASYIDPTDSTHLDVSTEQVSCLPDGLALCLEHSPIRSVLSNYLRNDSVLDMARHVPLFMALMEMLRALASKNSLVPLLLPKGVAATGASAGPSGSINQLLSRLKDCANTYINRLKGSKKRKPVEPKKGPIPLKKPVQKESSSTDRSSDGSTEIASEALTVLIRNIQETSKIVEMQIEEYQKKVRLEKMHDGGSRHDENGFGSGDQQSLEEKYMHEMKGYQFDTFEFVADEGDDGKVEFLVPFHYAETLRTAVASGDFSYSSRSRRLAQEIASLSTSLPLSFSSSVFLRCDENRLDLMKVLITGPEDTPYANGCFEFDVYFPRDYPTSPMMVNLQTTGQHSIRFNPNLYNDGKVCLSILNTWHGRPEEKWNPQMSNLLQVLVSIQSLILVPDPYFNEPGYERSRGTPIGQQNSMDYNANIKQATIKWAMLEQLRNPAPCFKKLIRRHFFLKKNAVIKQCETWISQMKDHSSKKKSVNVHYEAMKRHFTLLKIELDKLSEDDPTKKEINEQSNEQSSEKTSEKTNEENNEISVETESPVMNLPELNDNENLVYV